MKNSLPFISVIMNCYNCEKYLSQAIDSVLNQTYKHWEIIFWDNLSSDLSAHIVNSYSDTRIKYFLAEKHAPLGEARNLAVEKASGDWVAFLDCDDMWFEDKLDLQVELINKSSTEVGLVYGRMRPLIEDGGEKFNLGQRAEENRTSFSNSKLPTGAVMKELLKECFVPLPSAMVKRTLFQKVGGINNHFQVAEDYDLFLKVASVSEFAAIDEVCCLYRIHGSNLSHKNYKKTFDESMELVFEYKGRWSEEVKHALTLWRARYLVAALRNNDWLTVILKLISFKTPFDLMGLLVEKFKKNRGQTIVR